MATNPLLASPFQMIQYKSSASASYTTSSPLALSCSTACPLPPGALYNASSGALQRVFTCRGGKTGLIAGKRAHIARGQPVYRVVCAQALQRKAQAHVCGTAALYKGDAESRVIRQAKRHGHLLSLHSTKRCTRPFLFSRHSSRSTRSMGKCARSVGSSVES